MYQVEESPTAHITVNKGRHKVKDGKFIYLNNGQEFELELFNPTNERIGVKIWINNKLISYNAIIIRPGDRVYLERFIDDSRKFKFDTYEVDGESKSVKKAIEKNGLIRVEFYKEDTTPQLGISTSPFDYTYNGGYNVPHHTYLCNAGTYGGGVVGTSLTTDTYGGLNLTSQSFGAYDASSTMVTNTSLNVCDIPSGIQPLKMETGRVEKGESSSQNLNSVDITLLPNVFHTVEYQIKPTSEMRMDAKTVVKTTKYCTNCGKKSRHTHKFCSSCGTKV